MHPSRLLLNGAVALCACLCACMCALVYLHVGVHMCTLVHVGGMSACAHRCMYMRTHIFVCMVRTHVHCACVCASVLKCTHVCMCVQACVYHFMCACVCTGACMCVRVQLPVRMCACMRTSRVCVSPCAYAWCVYGCRYRCVCMRARCVGVTHACVCLLWQVSRAGEGLA